MATLTAKEDLEIARSGSPNETSSRPGGDGPMSRMLSLKVLGPFQIEEPSGLKLLTRKVEALAAFLALPAGRLHQRGELAELLWGSRDDGHARHSLRQALSSLRQTLAGA